MTATESDIELQKLKLKTAEKEGENAANAHGHQRHVTWVQYVIGGLITAGVAAGGAFMAARYQFQSDIAETTQKYAKENRVIDLELAKLSLTILAGDYQEDVEKSLPARMFALDALERGTGVTINDKETWAKTGLTPNADIVSAVGNPSFQDLPKPENIPCVTGTTEHIQEPTRRCGEFRTFDPQTDETCITIANSNGIFCGALTGSRARLASEDPLWRPIIKEMFDLTGQKQQQLEEQLQQIEELDLEGFADQEAPVPEE